MPFLNSWSASVRGFVCTYSLALWLPRLDPSPCNRQPACGACRIPSPFSRRRLQTGPAVHAGGPDPRWPWPSRPRPSTCAAPRLCRGIRRPWGDESREAVPDMLPTTWPSCCIGLSIGYVGRLLHQAETTRCAEGMFLPILLSRDAEPYTTRLVVTNLGQDAGKTKGGAAE